MYKQIVMLCLSVVLVCSLGGCAKVSQENYEKVKVGMTESEVEDILGSGKVQESGGASVGVFSLSGKVVRWGDDSKNITVTFANGEVIAKSQEGL